MSARKEHSFLQKMTRYAEASSKAGIKRDMEAFVNLEDECRRRLNMFSHMKEYVSSGRVGFVGRRATKIRRTGDGCVLGTFDGQIIRISREVLRGARNNLECVPLSDGDDGSFERERIFETPVQNIFPGETPLFISCGGKVRASSIYDMGVFVQNSDFHRGLSLLLATNEAGEIFAFDLDAMKPVFKNRIGQVQSLKVHRDGNVLICAEKHARLVDIRSMKTIVSLGSRVSGSVFLKDHIVGVASGNLIEAFDMRSLNCIGNILSHMHPVCFMETSGDTLCSGTVAGEICVSTPSISLIHKELSVDGGIDCIDIGEEDKSILCGKGSEVSEFRCGLRRE